MKNKIGIRGNWTILGVAICFLGLTSHTQEEGMFPLNLVNYAQIKEAGLKLDEKDIFMPGEVTLSDALVKIGGCTGSFVSKDGLIITNHHCVYGEVAQLSTPENNYLENGFVAETREKEMPLKAPVRITVDYKDVSEGVLKDVNKYMGASEKAQKIKDNTIALLKTERAATPDLEVQISEMFVGRSYMLFRYILLEDARLVVAPPKSVGQFGGDTDNWEWPRHGGDFSIVRAYVDKNGKPAKYSADNVPYNPKKHLKIDATGAKENDFVFIMGYPGRTYRNRTARYLEFQEEKQLPIIQNWYKWQIDNIKTTYANNPDKLLAYAGELQSLENTEKNYRGKIQGLRRTQLVNQRISEDEAMMTQFSESKTVVNDVKALWAKQTDVANNRFNYLFLSNNSDAFKAAASAKMLSNSPATEANGKLDDMLSKYDLNDLVIDKSVTHELMRRLSIDNAEIKTWYENNKESIDNDPFFDAKKIRGLKSKDIPGLKSALMTFFEKFSIKLAAAVNSYDKVSEEIDAMLPQYANYREAYKKNGFIPDANSTLRLTYGYIKRYSPNDGETHLPFSTIDGVFEKENTKPDYNLPKVISDNLRVVNPPAFFLDKRSKKVAVNLLYNLDTTGGNSGSPILNAKGDLIGVNFDRSFTATINDYAWNDDYSRSIGVDIRYCIYIMTYVSKAPHIIKELGVQI